jgi:hypothetical protein
MIYNAVGKKPQIHYLMCSPGITLHLSLQRRWIRMADSLQMTKERH